MSANENHTGWGCCLLWKTYLFSKSFLCIVSHYHYAVGTVVKSAVTICNLSHFTKLQETTCQFLSKVRHINRCIGLCNKTVLDIHGVTPIFTISIQQLAQQLNTSYLHINASYLRSEKWCWTYLNRSLWCKNDNICSSGSSGRLNNSMMLLLSIWNNVIEFTRRKVITKNFDHQELHESLPCKHWCPHTCDYKINLCFIKWQTCMYS